MGCLHPEEVMEGTTIGQCCNHKGCSDVTVEARGGPP